MPPRDRAILAMIPSVVIANRILQYARALAGVIHCASRIADTLPDRLRGVIPGR
jgi:hypothetical protein